MWSSYTDVLLPFGLRVQRLAWIHDLEWSARRRVVLPAVQRRRPQHLSCARHHLLRPLASSLVLHSKGNQILPMCATVFTHPKMKYSWNKINSCYLSVCTPSCFVPAKQIGISRGGDCYKVIRPNKLGQVAPDPEQAPR